MQLFHPISTLAATLPKTLASTLLLAQSTNDYAVQAHQGSPAGGLVGLLIAVISIVALWKIFTKAGHPGWASIIPIYNAYILCKVAGKPGWWVLLMLIPLVNIVILFLVMLGLANNFGKGAGFAVGLFFLSFIFMPILAFSDARYQGPGSAGGYV